jgi:signal transduction histidine kinase
MTPPEPSKTTDQDCDAPELARVSLGSETTSVSALLECVATRLDAFGCVLWEVAPGSADAGARSTRNAYVLASWFPQKEIFAMHDLPLEGTATGRVIVTGKPTRESQIRLTGGSTRNHPFLARHDIQPMCSTPVRFLDGSHGALNLYRKSTVSPFSEDDLARLCSMADVVPLFYQSIRDKISLGLLRQIEQTIQVAEGGSVSPLKSSAATSVLSDICKAVAATFHALEVSIFLRDSLQMPGSYSLMATTWPKPVERPTYNADASEGITGWVLANSLPCNVFDLAHFDRDAEYIQSQFPGLRWNNSLKFPEAIVEVLGLKSREELPPLSCMLAPILEGTNVLGAIRCCTATRGPYYFSTREVSLLKLVAALISQLWSHRLKRREIERENNWWKAAVPKINGFIGLLQRELADTNSPLDLRQQKVHSEALHVARQLVKGAEINDIRLVDGEKGGELYFACTDGAAWQLGDKTSIEARLGRRFTLDELGESSVGASVFRSGEAQAITDMTQDPTTARPLLFPEAQWLITAPIVVNNSVIGVLDLRGCDEGGPPRHGETVARLLGQQLAIYHHTAYVLGQLSEAERKLKRNLEHITGLQEEQAQMFEDLAHQLKGPINQAQRRAERMAIKFPDDRDLLAARGLCRKANRVTQSMRLLADLTRGKTSPLVRSPLEWDRLVKALIEAAADNELSVPPDRYIRFHVERESFSVPWLPRVRVDFDLLEQAINCLLDNAAKYSYSNTVVRIYSGLTGSKRFHITVGNKGLRIRPSEVRDCMKRGWRGEQAKWATGEGSGIGLWIVDYIMKGHFGELVVVPTRADGYTEVKLVFPIEES